MASTRRLVFLGGIAALSFFAAPALASADIYCVDAGPVGCDHVGYTGSTGLQQSLTDAAAHSGADTVRIGAGTYATTSNAGVTYSSTDPVTIIGAGQGENGTSGAGPGAHPRPFPPHMGLK